MLIKSEKGIMNHLSVHLAWLYDAYVQIFCVRLQARVSVGLFEMGEKVDVESLDVAWYVNSSNFSSEFLIKECSPLAPF